MTIDAGQVLALLREREQTLATAESLTGGRLASLLTSVPGSSDVFLGGVVSYATSVKVRLLGVSQALVDEHGVVSAECATAMSRAAADLTGATYALATTGVAGPARQEDKPPGTVFVGVAGPQGEVGVPLHLVGDRELIQDRTCDEALTLIWDVLTGEQNPLG